MVSKPSINDHAILRLEERFRVDKDWLLNVLDEGKFVWLKGRGDSGSARKVRSGHLVYIPEKDEFCVVVMDDRSRLAITVLTEEMALNSPWRKGLDETAKLQAKKVLLGEEIVDDINFFLLYAEEREEFFVTVTARTVTYEWNNVIRSICKVQLLPEQIDIANKCCHLTQEQEKQVIAAVTSKIENKEMRPFCDLYVRTGNGKSVPITTKLSFASSLKHADQARRWSF